MKEISSSSLIQCLLYIPCIMIFWKNRLKVLKNLLKYLNNLNCYLPLEIPISVTYFQFVICFTVTMQNKSLYCVPYCQKVHLPLILDHLSPVELEMDHLSPGYRRRISKTNWHVEIKTLTKYHLTLVQPSLFFVTWFIKGGWLPPPL